jgi:hypothetical protein
MSGDFEQTSSKSTTPNSTSTYEYSYEPHESFQHKVILLARSFGDCQEEDIQLQRRRGDSFNRIVVAHVKRNDHTVAGIFRIPHLSTVTCADQSDGDHQQIDTEIQDQVAVLQFLASRDIPAPALLAFDASAANPTGLPYVFQDYSTGTCLSHVYADMSTGETNH